MRMSKRPRRVEVRRVATYKDGGTEVFRDAAGNQYFVDNRIRTTTRGKIYDRYPADDGATVIRDVRLVVTNENFNHIRRHQSSYRHGA